MLNFRKPAFWAIAAAAVCACLVLTWLVMRVWKGDESASNQRDQQFEEILSDAYGLDSARNPVYVFASSPIDGTYTAVGFLSNGSYRRSDLGAAVFRRIGDEDEYELVCSSRCAGGAGDDGGVQVLRLTYAADGADKSYDAVVSCSGELSAVQRTDASGAETELQAGASPFFSLIPYAGGAESYTFLKADGSVIASADCDLTWMSSCAYTASRLIWPETSAAAAESGDVYVFRAGSFSVIEADSGRVITTAGGMDWCGQPFTDEQWQALFPDGNAPAAGAAYSDRYLLRAGDDFCIFDMNGSVWLAELDASGRAQALYELTVVSEGEWTGAGQAKDVSYEWQCMIYDGLQPKMMPLRFACGPGAEISVSVTSGSLYTYHSDSGYTSGGRRCTAADGKAYWVPADDLLGLGYSGCVLNFTVRDGDSTVSGRLIVEPVRTDLSAGLTKVTYTLTLESGSAFTFSQEDGAFVLTPNG